MKFLQSFIIALLCVTFYGKNAVAQTGGILPGTFSVSSQGGANYELPITVPPGLQGIVPQLSIVYSSQNGNGIVGQGFGINGLSAISRTGAILPQDGFKGGINYNENDRFSLDGKRLLNTNSVAGGYGGDGATYSTEVQNWTKIVAHGDCGSGPCSFTVTLKSGITLEYGATSDSQIPAVGAVFESGDKENSIRKWCLNKLTDLNGNYITYTYTQQPKDQNNQPVITSSSNGQAYLETIAYTGNADLSPQRFVQFYYEARPDSFTEYLGGGTVNNLARLVAIQTEVLMENGSTEQVSNYKFSYAPNSALGISCLESIQLFDATGESMPAQTFQWTNGVNSFQSNPSVFTGNLNNDGWVADFNGDGLTDLITYSEQESFVLDSLYFSTGKSFEKGISLGAIFLDNLTPQLADFNGDGLADIIGLGMDTAVVWLCNGNGFDDVVGIGKIAYTGGENELWMADFNGDGRSDLMIAYGFQYLIYLSDGVVFKTPITLNTALNAELLALGDFNGDGLTDVYTSYQNSVDSLYLSNFSEGQNFYPAIPIPALNYNSESFISDFNQDGIDDILIVYGSSAYLNYANGNGFEPAITLNDIVLGDNGNWIGDYNGDGRADIFVNGTSTDSSTLYLNELGSGFVASCKLTGSGLNESNVWVGDFNGDGSTDLFSVQLTSQLLLSSNSQESEVDHNHLTNLLVGIDNGVGSATSISYLPITNNSIYKKSTETNDTLIEGIQSLNRYQPASISSTYTSPYPIQTVQTSIYVVDNYTVTAGASDEIKYDFTYEGAKVDMDGYGWLGYRQISKIDSTAGRISEQTLYQVFPLTGSLDEAHFYTLDNELMGQISTEYAVSDSSIAPNGIIFNVTKSSTRKTQYDYGVYAYAEEKNYYYDNYNNVIQTQEWDVADSTAILYKNYTFSNDLGNWQLGYLQQAIYASDSLGTNVLSGYGYTYDATTKDTTSIKDWVVDNEWLTTGYIHDPYGNVTATVNYRGDTSYTAYDTFYHSFPSKVTYVPNAQGERMSISIHYDPSFGVPDTAVDVNGHLTVSNYDGFGRNTASYVTNPNGDLVLYAASAYQLTGTNGFVQLASQLTSWNTSNFDTSWTYYDALGRSTQNVTLGFDGKKTLTDMEYDMNGNPLQVSIPYFSGDTPLWKRIKYDPYGRIIQVSEPMSKTDSIVCKYSYVGQSINVSNQSVANPKSTQLFFTILNGNRAYTHFVDENSDTIHFQYDLIGQTLKSWNAAFTINEYTYDGIGRPLTAENISLGKSTFKYDDVTGQELVISAMNDSILTETDALGRPIFQKYSNGDSLILEYDLAGFTNSKEALCRVTAQPGLIYEYNYDVQGLPSQTSLTFEGRTYQTAENYEPNQNLSTFTFPDNSVQRYSYSAQNFLTGIDLIDANQDSTRILSLTNYNAAGSILQLLFGNGVQSNQTFLATEDLASINVVDPSQKQLLNLKYSWNLAHQIDTLYRTGRISETVTYGYDPTGRLLNASPKKNKGFTFQYNGFGNMTRNDFLRISYTNFQPTTVQSPKGDTIQKLQYNAKGNLIKKTLYTKKATQTYTFDYDIWNKLTSVQLNGDTLTTYVYDYEGRLLKEVDYTTGQTTVYPCDGYAVIIINSDGTVQKNITDGNQLIAVVTTPDNGAETITYYHQNNVMSTVLTTNESGQAETDLAYTPYGGIRKKVVTEDSEPDYLFGSKEFDETSDQYYFSARYYDPYLATFTSADNQLGGSPWKVDAYNNYAFALNNPIKNADPSGHGVGDDIAEGAAILAVAVGEVALDVVSGGLLTPELAEADVATAAIIEAADGTVEATEVVEVNTDAAGYDFMDDDTDVEMDDDSDGDYTEKKVSLRTKYMGNTPQKTSPVGRKVIDRMIGEGTYKRRASGDIFKDSKGVWRAVKDADMSHIESAVKYWNREGYLHGPRSPKVRSFMYNDANYYLEYKRINRSEGGAMTERYRRPKRYAAKTYTPKTQRYRVTRRRR